MNRIEDANGVLADDTSGGPLCAVLEINGISDDVVTVLS
jgi:hypothetical protein